MTDYSLTSWSEGMFLRPHHFQQQERALGYEYKNLMNVSMPFRWGVWQLEVCREHLQSGQVKLTKLTAILPDMTLVDLSARDVNPEPLTIEASTSGTIVKLIVPVNSLKTRAVSSADDQAITRYTFDECPVIDSTSGSDVEHVQVNVLSLSLVANNEQQSGYVELPLCKIKEVTKDGCVLLDDQFLPPLLNIHSHSTVVKYLANVASMTKIRADSLSQRLLQGKSASASAIDFMMLQMLNRYEALIKVMTDNEHVHPYELFSLMQGYLGELATFSEVSKRVVLKHKYNHLNLGDVFFEVNQSVSQYLSVVLEQTATRLPLEASKFGIYVSPLPDKLILDSGQFVLAIKANIAEEDIRKHAPSQLKLGPSEQIRDLISSQVNGVTVKPMSVVPRQIPYKTGYVYFEIMKKGPFWNRLKESGGLALHLSGNFPNPSFELWSVRT